MAANESEKIFTKSFFLIFGALLFTALVMYALMSTVTEYATAMGSTATIAGLVSGIYVFGGLCSRIYSGDALERIGWRKIALVFMSIHFLACLLYFIVDNVTLLIIVRFVHGIGFGASANAIVTIASAILPKKRFSEAFGYFMLGTTIAVGLGPFIGGFLYDATGSTGCFAAASVFSALALIFIVLIDVDKYDVKDEIADEKSYSGHTLGMSYRKDSVEKRLEALRLGKEDPFLPSPELRYEEYPISREDVPRVLNQQHIRDASGLRAHMEKLRDTMKTCLRILPKYRQIYADAFREFCARRNELRRLRDPRRTERPISWEEYHEEMMRALKKRLHAKEESESLSVEIRGIEEGLPYLEEVLPRLPERLEPEQQRTVSRSIPERDDR